MTSTLRLQGYIDSIHNHYFAEQPLFIDREGRVKGSFFKCEIGSVFESITTHTHANSVAVSARLQVNLFDGTPIDAATLFTLAKSDEALVRLDRLSRIIHTLNHHASPFAHLPLHLSVHPRLPSIVVKDHGQVFERLLQFLQLSPRQFVIELPLSLAANAALANNVVNNYRARGFVLSSHVDDRSLAWLDSGESLPDLLKLNANFILARTDVLARIQQLAERFHLSILIKSAERQVIHQDVSSMLIESVG